MPPHIKAGLTATIVLVAVLAWLFRETIGMAASPLLVFGLVAFMVFALWLFPEVKKDKAGR
jgi:amino acid permease